MIAICRWMKAVRRVTASLLANVSSSIIVSSARFVDDLASAKSRSSFESM